MNIFTRHFFFLPIFLVISYLTIAQPDNQYRIKGTIQDATNSTPLGFANVALLSAADSSIIAGMATNEQGGFFLTLKEPGNYILRISFLGYSTQFQSFTAEKRFTNLGTFSLKPEATNLKAVEVEGRIPPVRQFKDTTQFNAAGYKVNKDATTEDLITKMPGITVQDGKVQAQGEEVKKVLVDNKPFFGDDATTALKNLPADVVDKIQVFDQQSDQSRFTGFNDGNTTKTLNIVTKGGMRNGLFGKIYAGGGTNDRYRAGATLNQFKGNQRITFLGQANNINEQNFAISDLVGAFSSGGNRGGGGGRGGPGGGGPGGGGFNMPGQNFLVNNKKGLVDTKAFGLNYSDNIGKKLELTASYFFNKSRNQAVQITNRRYALAKDSGQVYSELSNSNTDNINHRFTMRLTWNLDSSNSILYTPRFTYQQNNASTLTSGENLFGTRTINSTANNYTLDQSSWNMNHEVLLRHKFAKKGRTISLTSNLGNNATTGKTGQISANTFFTGEASSDTIRQKSDLDKKGWSLQNNLIYTEPISEKSQVSVTYAYNYALTNSERLTYKRNALTGLFDSLNPQLSNTFQSETPNQYAGLGYAFSDKKSNLNLNINFQQSYLSNQREYPVNNQINRTFQNVLPTASWRYSLSEKKNLRIVYRTSTNAPSVDQLQDVVNNTNPLQLSVGNAELKQDFQHNMFARYSSTHEKNNATFFAMLGGSATQRYIGSSTLVALKDTLADGIFLNKGSQLTRPVNLDGYISLRSFVSYGLPITKLKTNLNFNANANFNRTPGMLNGQVNYANSPVVGGGINFTSNISTSVDFNLGYYGTYTTVKNTLNATQDNSYLNQAITGKLNLVFLKSIVFNADYSQQIYSGLAAGFNTNFTLVNLGLGYKFLKNKQAELRGSVFDLLNQNTNVSRTITETYTEDVRSNNLTRYWMVTFTYNLRSFKQAEKTDGDRPPFPPGMMRPGGGGGHMFGPGG